MTIVTVIMLLFLGLVTAVMISWIAISHDRFTTTELKPGMEYEVSGRKYQFPDIKLEGRCLLMKTYVIENLRSLMTKVHKLFEHLQIGYHVSGGSLLGVIRQNVLPLPYDDDIDIHTEICNREYLFGPNFRQKANEFGLETVFLLGASLARADRHGAAVRLQHLTDGDDETCDVFFLQREVNQVCKIDSWLNGSFIKNSKEQWYAEDIYPRQTIEMDYGLTINVPANGRALLVKQYGNDVFKCAKIRPKVISHAFPERFLGLLWKSTA
jgi:hypothetical protein